MAEGKKRRRDTESMPKVQNGGSAQTPPTVTMLQKLEAYIEAIFYECAISAQYTANIQILFKLEDIVHRMPSSAFATQLPIAKDCGKRLITTVVDEWVKTQSEEIRVFCTTPGVNCATLVLLQRNNITCTINGKLHRLSIANEKARQVELAINLLRFPNILMEQIQRLRLGTLLDLEKDASALIALSDNFKISAAEMKQTLDSLSC
jgi:hypothetical protein